jgi:hypothetical protein
MNSPNSIPVLALHYMRLAFYELQKETNNRVDEARRNPKAFSDCSTKPHSEFYFDKADLLIKASVIIRNTDDIDDLKNLL